MKKHFFMTFSLLLAAVFLVACSNLSDSGQRNWDKINKRGMLKIATAGTLYPQYSLEDGNKNISKFLRTSPYKYSFTSMVVRSKDDSGIHSWSDLKGKKAAGAASTNYMKIAKKLGAKLVVYDNVTNDVYMKDLVNGRTDVIINDYYLQKIAVAAVKDKYAIKINQGLYANPYSTSFTLSLKNKVLQKKINKAVKDMRKDGTLTKLSKKFFQGEDVTKKHHNSYKKIDISDID